MAWWMACQWGRAWAENPGLPGTFGILVANKIYLLNLEGFCAIKSASCKFWSLYVWGKGGGRSGGFCQEKALSSSPLLPLGFVWLPLVFPTSALPGNNFALPMNESPQLSTRFFFFNYWKWDGGLCRNWVGWENMKLWAMKMVSRLWRIGGHSWKACVWTHNAFTTYFPNLSHVMLSQFHSYQKRNISLSILQSVAP